MMSSIRDVPEIYMSSGKLTIQDLGGFHVSMRRKFSYLYFTSFDHTSVTYRMGDVDLPRNPLAEEVVNSTHVY